MDQTGSIWIISEGARLEQPFLDLRECVVELSAFYDERGLLGLAFHPDFAANGRFCVSYNSALREGLSPEEANCIYSRKRQGWAPRERAAPFSKSFPRMDNERERDPF